MNIEALLFYIFSSIAIVFEVGFFTADFCQFLLIEKKKCKKPVMFRKEPDRDLEKHEYSLIRSKKYYSQQVGYDCR